MPLLRCLPSKIRPGQIAIEYMLLLGIVVAVVLVGFRTFLPRSYSISEKYFNAVSCGIMGPPPSGSFLDNTPN